MELAAIIILAALSQYLYFALRVGAGRSKFGVTAPSTSGDERWERLFRVQQNTMEQLVVFIPSTVIFALYLSALWVLVPGILFIVGRQLYALEYIGDPRSRTPGMALTLLSNAVLIIGALVGLLLKIF